MSMSTHVIGFAPPDEKWKRMKAVYDSCENAGLPVPKEVHEFFDGGSPDASGVEVDLEKAGAVEDWNEDSREGYEIDLSKVPKHVTKIRFYNAY